MKILFPIGSFYPAQSGGPNNTIYWITKALKDKGVQPIIITTSNGIKPKHNIYFNRWMSTYYGEIIYVKTAIHYLPIKAFFIAFKQMKKAQVIHLTAIFYPLSWSIALVNTLFYKKKIVWSPRGELDPQALVYSTWKKKPILSLINLFLKSKVTFHATCDAEKHYIRKVFGERVSIIEIPNYLDLPNLVYTDKKPYLLYLGRIHPVKAIENLIHALKCSEVFKNKNYTLKIAGHLNSKYGEFLKKLTQELGLKEKIEFLGHIDGKQKQVVLAEAKCLVIPSHTENFGNVVVEALAQQTPVIASKGTPWEILEEKEAGYWVENTPVDLAKAIDELLCMGEAEYTTMSENALQLAQQEFDINHKVSDWINVYKQLLNESQ